MASKLKGKSPELLQVEKPKVCIFGSWGVGKTWGMIDFPKCYIIDCEQGMTQPHYIEKLKRSGAAVMGVEDGSLDPSEVLNQIKLLATEDHPYETLVIDSISKLFKTVVGDKADELGDSDAFGASSKPGVALIRKITRLMSKIDMNVLTSAHEKEVYGMVAKSNGTSVREVTGMAPDVHKDINHDLNLVIQVLKQGPRRVFKPVKSRYENLPEGKMFNWDYDTFADLIGRDTIERKASKLSLADPKIVLELIRLADLLRLSDDELSKWHKKAKAEGFDEYTQSQAEGMLAWFQKKIATGEAA